MGPHSDELETGRQSRHVLERKSSNGKQFHAEADRGDLPGFRLFVVTVVVFFVVPIVVLFVEVVVDIFVEVVVRKAAVHAVGSEAGFALGWAGGG
jgi:hypothetical protein